MALETVLIEKVESFLVGNPASDRIRCSLRVSIRFSQRFIVWGGIERVDQQDRIKRNAAARRFNQVNLHTDQQNKRDSGQKTDLTHNDSREDEDGSQQLVPR